MSLALGHFQCAVDMYTKFYQDKPHQDFANSLFQLGRVNTNLKQFEVAVQLFRQSLKMRKQIHPEESHPDILASQLSIQEALLASDRMQRASQTWSRADRVSQDSPRFQKSLYVSNSPID